MFGPSPKNCTHWTVLVNFGPLQTLISNISGTSQDIQNWKTLQTMAIPPAFDEKSQVNFGPLTAWNYMSTSREAGVIRSTYEKSEKLLIIYNHSHIGRKKLVYFGPQTKKLLTNKFTP